jgi:hypothetical protein
MKAIYERIRAVRDIYSDYFPQGLSILLMLFFLLFGAVSLFILIQSPV